jgi:hypothetical protein
VIIDGFKEGLEVGSIFLVLCVEGAVIGISEGGFSLLTDQLNLFGINVTRIGFRTSLVNCGV